ncbi:MAG: GNAT family N-acetyltransferase [Rhodothermales bacterium]
MEDAFLIRPARREDRDALGALWAALLDEQAALDVRFAPAEDALERWRNDFPVWLQDEQQHLVVAEAKGELVGFITAQRWTPPPVYAEAHEVFIDEAYVRPEVRGKGIGTRLVEEVKAWAAKLDVDRLRLRMLVANEAGRRFWQRQGAEPFVATFTIDRDRTAPEATREKKAKLGF